MGRTSKVEHNRRIDLCVKLLAVGTPKWQIKELFRAPPFEVGYRATENYISRARQRIRERAGMDETEGRGVVLENLFRMLRDPEFSPYARIRVVEILSKIFCTEPRTTEDARNRETFERLVKDLAPTFQRN